MCEGTCEDDMGYSVLFRCSSLIFISGVSTSKYIFNINRASLCVKFKFKDRHHRFLYIYIYVELMCIVLIFQCDLMLCVAVSPFEQANIHLWWQQQMISNGGEITFLSALGKVCKNLFLQHTYDICPSSAFWYIISFFQLHIFFSSRFESTLFFNSWL